MSESSRRAAQRISTHARRQAQRHGRTVLRAQVVQSSPLRLELLEGDLQLDIDDDFALSLMLEATLNDDPADAGDIVLLHHDRGTYIAFDIRKDSQDSTGLPKAAEPYVSNIPRVSALPANARDGQEILFQTQTMAAAGVTPFRFQYRAVNPDGSTNTSPHKWESVGLPAGFLVSVAATVSTASATFIASGTGPAIVVPLAGLWEAHYGCQFNGGALPVYGISFGTAAGFPTDDESVLARYSSSLEQSPARISRGTVPNAGETIQAMYRDGGGGTGSFFRRWLAVRPVRVG